MKQNPHGFIRYEDGTMVETSPVSALSGKKLGTGCYTCPVPGRPTLRYRITASEMTRLTPEQEQSIVDKAATLYPEPAPIPRRKVNQKPSEETLEDERGEHDNG